MSTRIVLLMFFALGAGCGSATDYTVDEIAQNDVDALTSSCKMPSSTYTPGVLCTTSDKDFSTLRYAEQIPYCTRNVSSSLKDQVAAEYGVAKANYSSYEFDHWYPLAIGGSNNIKNLWPQPNSENSGSNSKDALEDRLYNAMNAGTMTQKQAVAAINAWHC
jgi:hypothetical protein